MSHVGQAFYIDRTGKRLDFTQKIIINLIVLFALLQTESDDFAQSTAHGMRVFRGKDMGERQMKSLYKTDWRLVPRDQEKDFLSAVSALPREPNKVPDTLPLPPLLRHMILKDLEMEGKGEDSLPKLRPTIQKHYAANALYEGEEQTLDNLG